jgi:putative ABC transport system permease protein
MKIRWLLFKQGFKSIFKYKLQFVIITILTFIAALYLVATISTSQRIDTLYDEVMGSAEQFDYTYNKKITNSNNTVTNLNDIYIPMNDFVNGDYTNDGTSTGVNFFLSDFGDNDDHDSTFISDAFAQEKWQEIFASQYVSWDGDDGHYNGGDENNIFKGEWDTAKENSDPSKNMQPRFGQLGVVTTSYAIDSGKGDSHFSIEAMSGINSLNETVEYNGYGYKNYGFAFTRFTATTVAYLMDQFMQYYFGDTDKAKDHLAKVDATSPLVVQYLKNNQDEVAYLNNMIYGKDNLDINNDDWMFAGWRRLSTNFQSWRDSTMPDSVRYQKDPLFTLMYAAFSSLSFEMLNDIISFEKNVWSAFKASDDYTKAKADTSQPLQDAIPAAYAKFNQTQNGVAKNLTIYNGDTVRKQVGGGDAAQIVTYEASAVSHMVADYEFIFGKEFKLGSTEKYNDAIGSDHVANFIVNDTKTQYKKSILPGDTNDTGMDSFNKYQNGLRGMTNPIQYSSSDNKYTSLSIDTSYSVIGRFEWNQSFQSSRGGLNNSYTDMDLAREWSDAKEITASGKNNFITEKFHQEMAAQITGMDLYVREEGYVYDSASKKSYRFVIDDADAKAKGYQDIVKIEGTTATSENEILINEQFAVKNGYSVGDEINIGGVRKIISGFAVDSLSYYPLTDMTIGSPDIVNGGIIYLTKESLINLAKAAGISNSISMNNYYFLKKANDNVNVDDSIKLFSALTSTSVSNMTVSSDILQNQSDSQYWNSYNDWSNGNNVEQFAETNFQKNWTIQPTFSNSLKIVAIGISVIILGLSFIAIAFAIRKNIQSNATQIAYLKSLGTRSGELAFSYIGYSVIITFLIVPLAWVVGGLAQELIVRMFMQYLSTELFQFVFDWKILLIFMAIIGLSSFIFSILIAIFYNRKSINKILHGTYVTKLKYKDKGGHGLFNKLPFNSRFNLKLARRGLGSVITISITSLVLTALITFFTFIPSILEKYINDAYTFFQYDNAYSQEIPYANSPMSAKATDAWNGIDRIEEDNNTDKLSGSDFGDYMYTFYDDPTEYGQSVSETGIMAPFKAKSDTDYTTEDKNVQWLQEYLYGAAGAAGDDTDSDDIASNSFLMVLLSSLIDRLVTPTGLSVSMGQFEQMLATSLYTTFKADGSGDSYSPDAAYERLSTLINSSAALKEGIPTLIQTLAPSFDFTPTDDWRKTIIFLLESMMPSSFDNYLTSDARIGQFNIGINTEEYVPGKETLATNVDGVMSDGIAVNIDGLKQNQNVYRLNNLNTGDTFLDDATVKMLTDLFEGNGDPDELNSEISQLQSMGLYNSDTSTVNIPVIVNKTMNKVIDYSKNVDLQTNVIKLSQLASQSDYISTIIPKGAWIYDNRDYAAYSGNDQEWLNPYELSSAHFIDEYQYKKSDDKYQVLKDTSYFNELVQNADGTYSNNFRPYYNYANLRLYFPKSAVANVNDLIAGGSRADVDRKISDDSDPLGNQKGWYGTVSGKQVPDTVKTAWNNNRTSGTTDSEEWLFIDPYNMQYSTLYDGDGSVSIDQYNLTGSLVTFQNENIDAASSLIVTGKEKNVTKYVKNIKFKHVDTLKTYNDDVIVADQDLLNLVMGYDTSKFVSVNNTPIGDQAAYSYALGNGQSLNAYDFRSIDSIKNAKSDEAAKYVYGANTLFGGNTSKALQASTQSRWFNKKYSGIVEPIGITTTFKASTTNGSGFSTIPGAFDQFLNNLSSPYSGIDLASARVGVIASIARVILGVAILAIVAAIIIAVLFLSLMADAFVARYQRFILVMKSLGYRRVNIISNVLSVQMILNVFAIVIGVIVGSILTRVVLNIANASFDFGVPYVVVWWTPIVVLAIIFGSLIISYVLSMTKTLNSKPTLLFKTD